MHLSISSRTVIIAEVSPRESASFLPLFKMALHAFMAIPITPVSCFLVSREW